MVAIGIVGTGFMARTHATRYATMDDVSIDAVVSRSDADTFVDEYAPGARVFDSVEALCGEGIHAIDVCSPTNTHAEIVTLAAESGIDVLCEKPLTRTLEEARALADVAAEAGVTVMPGHVLRFFPAYARAKSLVDAGEIGAAGVARARRLSPRPDWGAGDWFDDRAKSGGVFLDLAIHDLDFLRWVWGEVEHVFARCAHAHGTVTLRFESGAVGYVEASWAQPTSRELTSEFELAGDEGLIEFDGTASDPYRCFTNDGQHVPDPYMREDGYYRELRHFVDCLQSGTTPDVTIEDGITAMRLSLAAIESAERGRPVDPAAIGDATEVDA